MLPVQGRIEIRKVDGEVGYKADDVIEYYIITYNDKNTTLEDAKIEVTLPERPTVVELKSEFECTFGFALEYYPNAEYKIDGEYQSGTVFVGLESGKTYTVTIRLAATDNSFASNTIEVEVTTK